MSAVSPAFFAVFCATVFSAFLAAASSAVNGLPIETLSPVLGPAFCAFSALSFAVSAADFWGAFFSGVSLFVVFLSASASDFFSTPRFSSGRSSALSIAETAALVAAVVAADVATALVTGLLKNFFNRPWPFSAFGFTRTRFFTFFLFVFRFTVASVVRVDININATFAIATSTKQRL